MTMPQLKPCRKCRGAGEVLVQVHVFSSPDDYYKTCRDCHGAGVEYPYVPSRPGVRA